MKKTLKELREEKGLTQIEMSRMIKTSLQNYRNYEQFYYINMPLEMEKAISEVLGIEFKYERG